MTSKISACSTPPIEGTISNIADWVELKVLSSSFLAYNLPDILSLTEQYEDEENENIGEQDHTKEDLESRIVEEIAHRKTVLGDSYPFDLKNSDREIYLNMAISNIGQWIYLYCLIISHRKADTVNETEFNLSNADRDLLQIASIYAAVGHFGKAISFGFPRPDQSGIINALKKAFNQVGEGRTVSRIKLGSSPFIKDGEVDIIAWQDMNDRLPGKKFLLGQVATGSNWQDKSIKGVIEHFFFTCFDEKPVSTPISGMFIPFCIDEEYNGSRHQVMTTLTSQFGIIYNRLRLPYYALQGFKVDYDFERKNESDKIIAFVKSSLGSDLTCRT